MLVDTQTDRQTHVNMLGGPNYCSRGVMPFSEHHCAICTDGAIMSETEVAKSWS